MKPDQVRRPVRGIAGIVLVLGGLVVALAGFSQSLSGLLPEGAFWAAAGLIIFTGAWLVRAPPARRSRASSDGGRSLWRGAAAVVLVGVVSTLYWGAFEQEARRYPFHTPDLPSWFLEKVPHPAHREMPVVPAGSFGGLVPRGLCAVPEPACGGLEIADDGRAFLRLDRSIEMLARVHPARSTGHAFAVSARGEVWQLIQDGPPAWQRIRIPDSSADQTRAAYADQPQPPVILQSHEGPVWSAAFSPDGARMVTASKDGDARVWDADGGQEPIVLRGHDGDVRSAVFSPDGARVVTASYDGTARVWSFGPPVPVVTDIALDGGRALWMVGRDGYAAIADATGYRPVLTDRSRDLLGVALLQGGRAMAVGAGGLVVTLAAAQGIEPGAGEADAQQAQEQQARQQQVQQNFEKEPQQQIQQQLPQEQQQQQFQAQQAPEQLEVAASFQIEEAGERTLRAVVFPDDQRGWIAGDNGLLLHTNDAGQTWLKVHDGGGYRLTDVHVQANGLGWALGEAEDSRRMVLAAKNASDAQSWRELPHHVAPWWFLLGIPGFILAGFLNVWAWRLEPPPPEASITGAATSDRPLTSRDPDARVLWPLARGLARFLRNVNTEPPLTIAITGRWGSGKSSLMNLLQEDLKRVGARPVWFNAWHHREEEHLLAALFAAVRRQGPPGWWLDRGLAFRLRLLWLRSRTALVNLFYLLLFALIVVVTVRLSHDWLTLPEAQALLMRVGTWFEGEGALSEFLRAYGGAVLGSGGLALFALWLRGKMVALPANPAKLVAALARRASIGDLSDKLSFRDRFAGQFSEVCQALRTRTSPGLMILIDDLDRCQPEDTLKVLEAVNYFVSAGPCIVVLGMDRRQVEYCVGLGFEKLVEGLPDDELLYEDELVYDNEGRVLKSAKQRAFARHYLEKLVNIEVPVPALTDEALEAMLATPEAEREAEPDEEQGGWWRRLMNRLKRGNGTASGDQGATRQRARPTEPPRWLDGLKSGVGTSAPVARVGVLAFVLGWLMVWGIDKMRQSPQEEVAPTEIAATEGQAAPRLWQNLLRARRWISRARRRQPGWPIILRNSRYPRKHGQ